LSEKHTDFQLLKIEGEDKTFIRLWADTKKSVQALCQHAGKIAVESREVSYTSVKDVKRFIKDNEAIHKKSNGYIFSVPKISVPVWDTRLAKMCKMDEEDAEMLYELFDEEIEISSVRSWYYTNMAKYILKVFICPLTKMCKNMEKEIVFDLGNIEMQYDLMKKIIDPFTLKKAGITLAVHKDDGNIEKELGFSDSDFIIYGDTLKRATKEDARILLVKPARGIMERFIQGEIKERPIRLETPALLSGIESVYYSDMLTEHGYSFDVTDEIHLPKENDLKKYENVLICKSCLFTEKEKKKIDKIQKYGVKINDTELICDLTQKGEN